MLEKELFFFFLSLFFKSKIALQSLGEMPGASKSLVQIIFPIWISQGGKKILSSQEFQG